MLWRLELIVIQWNLSKLFLLDIFLSSVEDILSFILEVYAKLFGFTWNTKKTWEFKFENIRVLSQFFVVILDSFLFMLPHFCYQHFAGVTVCVTRIDDICGQKQWKSDELRVPTATLGMCRVKLLSYLGGSFSYWWISNGCSWHLFMKSFLLSCMHFIY